METSFKTLHKINASNKKSWAVMLVNVKWSWSSISAIQLIDFPYKVWFSMSYYNIQIFIPSFYFLKDMLFNVPQNVVLGKNKIVTFSSGCCVTYFIYAKSCMDPKWMDTLHAYNLQNETFPSYRGWNWKRKDKDGLFQNRSDSAIMLRSDIWCNVAKFSFNLQQMC